jgi:hypothetical protein
MKYRVYYLDEPGSNDIVVEAPDDHAAAQQFFSQHPRNERRRIRVEAKSFGNYSVTDFEASEFMDEATRASLPPLPAPQPVAKSTPTAPIPGLAVAFRVLAALEFIGGFIWCCLLWPGKPAAGYEWKSVAYMTPFVFLMAGIIFGCLFLAIADALIYLRHIRDSLARKT